MIYVTRLNHAPVVLNCELIECVETTPDTVISLTTGQKLMVLESPEEIIARAVEYRRSIQAWIDPAGCRPANADQAAITGAGPDTHGRR